MSINGKLTADGVRSTCCGATLTASVADGVLAGSCRECDEYVTRINPQTGAHEYLDGRNPWTRHEGLRPVEDAPAGVEPRTAP